MAIYSITFSNPITRELLSEGDSLFFAINSDANITNTGNIFYIEDTFRNFGTILQSPLPFPQPSANQLFFDYSGGDINDISLGDYVLAAKAGLNVSGIKGYYAKVLFKNNSKHKAELFAIGSQIQPSSK
jgi:hypothetical protein